MMMMMMGAMEDCKFDENLCFSLQNFFSKRSFKSNPLKRTKSVTKLERKKPTGNEPER